MFMGFSITSAVFGGVIIIVYSIGFATLRNWYYDDYDYYDYDYGPTVGYDSIGYRSRAGYRHDTQMALMGLILLLGIVEFATGIWAAVCLCLMKPCTCCYDNPPQQVSGPRQIKHLFKLNNIVNNTVPHKVPLGSFHENSCTLMLSTEK